MYISSRMYNVSLNPSHPCPGAVCIFHVYKLQTEHMHTGQCAFRLLTDQRLLYTHFQTYPNYLHLHLSSRILGL